MNSICFALVCLTLICPLVNFVGFCLMYCLKNNPLLIIDEVEFEILVSQHRKLLRGMLCKRDRFWNKILLPSEDALKKIASFKVKNLPHALEVMMKCNSEESSGKLVVYSKPTVEPSLESYQELLAKNILLQSCAESLRDDLRPLVRQFGGWVGDVFTRIVRLIEIRQICDNIYMSDPPTRWEIMQREACELGFQAAIVYEIARLDYEISQMLLTYPAIIRESIENFLGCTNEEIPDSYQFRQILASMQRNELSYS